MTNQTEGYFSPVTAPRKKRRKLLQKLLVNPIKPIQHRTVDVNNGNRLDRSRTIYVRQDGHDNLAFAAPVTGDMPWELIHIVHQLCGLRLGRCAADASPEGYRLTGYFALEGAENELRFVCC